MSTTPSRVHMAMGFDPNEDVDLNPETAKLLERRDRVLGPSYRLFYREPVAIEGGKGVWLKGLDGRDYLDAYNNVPVIGHSHPAVTEAVTKQLSTLNTHTRYLTETVVEYSERLLATFPDELDRVTYTCTGSEAIDLAIRTARYATGNRGLIISEHAYHGTTVAAAGVSPSLGPNNPLGEDVVTIPSIDTARTSADQVAAKLEADVRAAIAKLEASGAGVAAILLDSILSSDGVQVEPAGFLAPLVDLVHDAGGLYIADEVQPGFGRTGNWWGFERHGLVPDLAVLGKPMGNGIPIAALVGTAAAQQKFGEEIRYFNTFGGNPVSIAAAGAVLDVIEQEGLRQNAAKVGGMLLEGLERIGTTDDRVLHVRGARLFLAMEFADAQGQPDAALAARVVNGMRDEGVLISASGPAAAALKIRPPLVFDKTNAEQLLDTLERVLRGQ
ncbi:aspartate aminotransferase family protein [Gulosibacter chungangensis]|uniref:Aspartate aminotransferase family protein n=1 Tax=Gulosibacter chungangensis TaxID=979746 RepID=A0A7J5BHW5_9MICO|nr:aspartate aminotransferase family protein [Gulosibacter chungangensis]KAB1645029.1 aspartate aminotransferase family protein [Gulosibacter chungangensis]